jgi:uncharacterized delta-60 repeat protein
LGLTDTWAGTGPNFTVNNSALQTDGKIIIVGEFTGYNGYVRNRIARLNTNGTIDTTFNPGTGPGNAVYDIAIQTDGKIIIVGNFTSYNGIARSYITRINSNGSLDTTFNPGTGANSPIQTISIQSDGKIIIGGGFSTYNGTAKSNVARLNIDGSLDVTFNSSANLTVRSTLIQPNGKIIIGGNFTTCNGISRNGIARLNADGTLDTGFNPGTGTSGVFCISIQTDGKIIIGGGFTSYNGTARNGIARITSSGLLDATLNPGTGVNANAIIRAVSVQSDSKIIIGGDFTSYNGTAINKIARINTNGTLDGTFIPGDIPTNNVLAISLQSDGKIIIGGNFTGYVWNGLNRNRIVRLNTNGSHDFSFNPVRGLNGMINCTAIQTDGKIIVGGSFTYYNDAPLNNHSIARLNADGSIDATFNAETSGSVSAVAIQSDGKIIIGGSFTSLNGTAINNIARLNANGSIDATFNPGTGLNANAIIRAVSVQSDSKIIIGGNFTSYNGISRNGIARLNADGTLDTGFNPGTGTSGVFCISIQTDGKIIIGGDFTFYNGTVRPRVARLNANGTLDATFNPGTGANNSVFATHIQSDGKIIIGGKFTSYIGNARGGIARINTNGSIDASFNPGTGINVASNESSIRAIAIQTDGKIVIGGNFTTNNGSIVNQITRLNVNGTFDECFNIGIGLSNPYTNVIYSTIIQTDGKIIIGGNFAYHNYISRNSISRIYGGGSSITGILATCTGSTTQLTGSETPATTNAWTSSNASIASVSSTGLVTGIATGTVSITYVNNAGCNATSTFTVTAPPTVTGALTTCEGSTTQLTGSGNPSTTNAWTSSSPNIASVGSTGLVTGVTSGTASITYVNSAGCTTVSTVTITAAPTITGTLNACAGATSQLTGSGTSATTGPWTSSSTGIASVSSTGLVTGVGAGTATITYKNNAGCTTTSTFTVKATPSISTVANQNSCSGQTVAATNFTSSPTGATFSWANSNTANGLQATGTGNISSYTAPLTSNVINSQITVSATLNNCNSTPTTFSININPIPTITNTIDTTIACGSATASLIPASSVTGTTFNWVTQSSGATLTGYTATGTGAINQIISNSGNVPGTVVYVITPTANGCVGTPANYSVTVNPIPNANFSIISNTLCINQSPVSLTPVLSGGVFSGTGVSQNTFNPLVSGVGTFTVSYLISQNNCFNSSTQTISVNTIDNANFSINDFCAGNAGQATISGVQGGSFTLIPNTNGETISSNGTIVSGVAGTTYTITYTTPGSGCQNSSTDVVTIFALPNAPDVNLVNDTLRTTAIAASYLWYYNGATTGVTTSYYEPGTSSGNYQIEITDANGCSSISQNYFYQFIGLNQIINDNTSHVKIYPNPANNQLFLETGNNMNISFKLIDILGKEVMLLDAQQIQQKNNKLILDIEFVKPAIYFYEIISDSKIIDKGKIIIQK